MRSAPCVRIISTAEVRVIYICHGGGKGRIISKREKNLGQRDGLYGYAVLARHDCGGNHSINRFQYTDFRLFDDNSETIWITDRRRGE